MKKNKKLFAILTLVAFMMSLVPALAFAADSDAQAKSVTISGTNVAITFDKLLDGSADDADFAVTVDGTSVALVDQPATVAGKTVTVELATALTMPGTVEVKYSTNNASAVLADSDGNLIKDFTASTKLEATAPQMESAVVKSDATGSAAGIITVTFDKAIAAAPAETAWTVKVGTATETVTNVSALSSDGKSVDLTLTTTTPANYLAGKIITVKLAEDSVADGTFTGLKNAEQTINVELKNSNKGATSLSAFVATNGDTSVKAVTSASEILVNGTNAVDFYLAAYDIYGNDYANGFNNLYVWALDENGAVTSAMKVTSSSATPTVSDVTNAYKFSAAPNKSHFQMSFTQAGKYVVYAGILDDNATTKTIANMQLIGGTAANFSTINVSSTTKNPEEVYSAKVNTTNDTSLGYKVESNNVVTAKESINGKELGTLTLTPNNVSTNNIVLTFYSEDKALISKNVTISTDSGNITVNKSAAKTNVLGQIQIQVSANREGKYNIYFEVDGVQYVLKVKSGNTSAAAIELANQPKAPQALYANDTKVRFHITDINGNLVDTLNDEGMDGIRGNSVSGKYVVLTEKPSASTMRSEDLYLQYNENKETFDLKTPSFDAEGVYSVKVILDNGAYATATWEVKKFETPVQLKIEYSTNTVELGGKITASLTYVDTNGVEKNATDADFAATGYAVESLTGKTIVVKSDEKYVGSKINVTAASSRYDLIGTAELTVAEGASAINFATDAIAVNVNNKVVWNIVDANGNKVALGDNKAVSIDEVKYIVTSKPEGAKVSTYDATIKSDLINKGEGRVAITSDTKGDVTVQVVLKATYTTTTTGTTNTVNQVKYYTGTQTFKVGSDSAAAKTTVVMSIGSHEMVKNGVVSDIDAAPMIQDNRTFVPFRALTEAFGATVEYDAASNTVTAVLGSTTVTLTIGSSVMTVGDEAKTLDVAPFISGDRTMVPVRAVAEAFGFNVEATSNPDGTTADVVFTK